MTLTLVLAAVILAMMALFALSLNSKAKLAQKKIIQAEQNNQKTLLKLEVMRNELVLTKETLVKKSRALAESKEQTKKKLKKQGQKLESHIGSLDANISALSGDNEKTSTLKNSLAAMQIQLLEMKKDSDKAKKDMKAELELEQKEKVSKLQDEMKNLKTTLTGIKKRENQLRRGSHLSQLKTNADSLPVEVLSELSRLVRKSQTDEKLRSANIGKLQMASEKFAELQKRYFSVCRELALAAGKKKDISKVEARDIAEVLIKASENSH